MVGISNWKEEGAVVEWGAFCKSKTGLKEKRKIPEALPRKIPGGKGHMEKFELHGKYGTWGRPSAYKRTVKKTQGLLDNVPRRSTGSRGGTGRGKRKGMKL